MLPRIFVERCRTLLGWSASAPDPDGELPPKINEFGALALEMLKTTLFQLIGCICRKILFNLLFSSRLCFHAFYFCPCRRSAPLIALQTQPSTQGAPFTALQAQRCRNSASRTRLRGGCLSSACRSLFGWSANRKTRKAQGKPEKAQDSPGKPRRAQESPAETGRAQETPGEPRRAQESPGGPRRA